MRLTLPWIKRSPIEANYHVNGRPEEPRRILRPCRRPSAPYFHGLWDERKSSEPPNRIIRIIRMNAYGSAKAEGEKFLRASGEVLGGAHGGFHGILRQELCQDDAPPDAKRNPSERTVVREPWTRTFPARSSKFDERHYGFYHFTAKASPRGMTSREEIQNQAFELTVTRKIPVAEFRAISSLAAKRPAWSALQG